MGPKAKSNYLTEEITYFFHEYICIFFSTRFIKVKLVSYIFDNRVSITAHDLNSYEFRFPQQPDPREPLVYQAKKVAI